MAYVADFDASQYVSSNVATWPQPPPYSPGDWWYVTTAGVVDGSAASVGDRLYAMGRGRRYGELLWGDDSYGPAAPDPPWPADDLRVDWRVVSTSAPAWDTPPPPYAGCPFVRPDWRVVVELLYNADPATRTYGMLNYGDDVYGSTNATGLTWVDVTSSAFGIVIKRGAEDGSPVVDVDSAQIDLHDVDASLFPMLPSAVSPDGVIRYPHVSTPCRVSVIDPSGLFHPLFAGRVERIVDQHDYGRRTLQLDAFGFGADLTTTVVMGSRSSEGAADRLRYLLRRAEWEWGRRAFPSEPGPLLRRLEANSQALVRELADSTAISASWTLGTDRWGQLIARTWPLVPSSNMIEVTDVRGAAALPSPSISYVADTTELLNVANVASASVQGSPELVSERRDDVSIGRYGAHSEALGFPLSNLAAVQSDLNALAAAARDRYARIVNRCASVEADTTLDVRWLDVLADVDISASVRTRRTKPTPLELDGVLVGVEHRLTRDRWLASLYLSTTTPTI